MYFPGFVDIGVGELLAIAFCLSLAGIISHYVLHISPVSSKPEDEVKQDEKKPVSVIICARNEDDNLTEFLPKILTQDYPQFEVIVVNDCSTDNTENVIDEFAKIFPNLKKVNIKEDSYYKHGKKFAVLVGIKAASHEQLLFTDADCFPASEQWISGMSSGFTSAKEIVLGYGAYKKEPGLLNKLIRFDTFLIAANYLSAAIKGKAYMGVGRNLAYKKELFYKHKGFSKHYHIESGDDDLFINEACTQNNTAVVLSYSAFTYSIPKTTFLNWKRQKQRHLTTAPHYNAATRLKIAQAYILQYVFYILFFASLCFKATFISALVGLLIKIGVQVGIFKKVAKKLNEPDMWQMSFLYEFMLLVIYPVFHISKIFHKPNKWKS